MWTKRHVYLYIFTNVLSPHKNFMKNTSIFIENLIAHGLVASKARLDSQQTARPRARKLNFNFKQFSSIFENLIANGLVASKARLDSRQIARPRARKLS